MPRNFFVGLGPTNFVRKNGTVEIYFVKNPTSHNKLYIPISGTEALTPAIYDNNSLRYVLYGEEVILIKKFPFVPCLKIDNLEQVFPFPKEYVLQKLNKKEKENIKTDIPFDLFQTVVL
jgi:hypothetical protein